MTNASARASAAAGIRPVRTLLVTSLILGVPERAVMGIMGWSNTAMAARYQHITAPIQRDVAQRLGGLIWRLDQDAPGGNRD